MSWQLRLNQNKSGAKDTIVADGRGGGGAILDPMAWVITCFLFKKLDGKWRQDSTNPRYLRLEMWPMWEIWIQFSRLQPGLTSTIEGILGVNHQMKDLCPSVTNKMKIKTLSTIKSKPNYLTYAGCLWWVLKHDKHNLYIHTVFMEI